MKEEGGKRDGDLIRAEIVVRGKLIEIRMIVGVEEGLGFREGAEVIDRKRDKKVEEKG